MKSKEFRGLINLSTYSRPTLLRECLKSLYGMDGAELIDKLIIVQMGNIEVETLVESFRDSRTRVIKVNGSDKSALENMNYNRWLSWKVGFDQLEYDWMLSAEEDVVVHRHSLQFVQSMIDRYHNDKFFRGINLGSKLTEANLQCTYSNLRFGLHGCAGVITRSTWEIIKRLGIERKIKKFPLDACIEHVLKSGFMTTPNLSMYKDFGWFEGTHTSSDSDNPHYRNVAESFLLNNKVCVSYKHFPMIPNWREDCLLYSHKENRKYRIRLYLSLFLNTTPYVKLLTFARNTNRFFAGKDFVR